jgi:hypothetical protein
MALCSLAGRGQGDHPPHHGKRGIGKKELDALIQSKEEKWHEHFSDKG